MLEALRLFIELDISAASLHINGANKEQKLFISLLSRIQEQPDGLFEFPKAPSLRTLKDVLQKKTELEKADFIERSKDSRGTHYYTKRLAMYDRGTKAASEWDGTKLVIHGIHQFSPVQLRFLIAVEKMGVDIIFLHNYQDEFQSIYSSWDYIYQFFGAETHRDANIERYHAAGQLSSPGHALAKAMALMCEDGTIKKDHRFQQCFALYKKMKVSRFENISEYASYISDLIDEARRTVEQQQLLYERPYKKTGTAAILGQMDELVYTANKDVDELLHLYYPEYSQSKHFLSYPIGQFFVALYRLWDWRTGNISIEFSSIRECLNSGLLTKYPSAELLKTAINLEPLFENVKSYPDFMKRLKSQFLPQFQEVSSSVVDSAAYPFQTMNIYHTYKVSQRNILNFMAALEEINKTAQFLFKTDGGQKNYLSFAKHFRALDEVIRTQQTDLADERERDLIDQLLEHFETMRSSWSESGMGGTFEDLRNGIYFFLKQKEEPDPNWLVKNFEQIDGDILGSKLQNQPGRKKTYHFACVSDRDMNQAVNDMLPWPLNDRFIERAYTPVDLQFQVYYAALGERSNFLRYCLFYGLYYNQCDSQISYVTQYSNEVTEEYSLLKLLGVQEESAGLHDSRDEDSIRMTWADKQVNFLEYAQVHMMDFFICPYRYFFDYVLNPRPCSSNDFLFGNLFENVLIERIWRKLGGSSTDMAAKKYNQVLDQETNVLKRYFPFWRESEFADLQRKADNYFKYHIVTNENRKNRNSAISSYDAQHMTVRKHFGKGAFMVDPAKEAPGKPLGNFIKLLRIEEGKRKYSPHLVPRAGRQDQLREELLQSVAAYLNDSDGPEEHTGEWCQNCPNKDICLRFYTIES